jgi:hypothetical protein
VQPAVEGLASQPGIDREREQRLRRDHPRSGFRLVLQMRAAEGTFLGDDPVFEQHHRPATGAARLRRAARVDGVGPGVLLREGFLEVAFDDGLEVGLGLGNDRGMAAIGALQRPRSRIELDLRSAIRTGEEFPGRRSGGMGRI